MVLGSSSMAEGRGPRPHSVGFMTEVDFAEEDKSPSRSKAEPPELKDYEDPVPATPASSSSMRVAKATTTAEALPVINVYRVEEAEIPDEVFGDLRTLSPLPSTIPMDKVMTNILGNLESRFKGWSEQARNLWFKDFKSASSRAFINDTFWFCICWYFKAGKHPEVEKMLFHRISANFVGLSSTVNPARKDVFFKSYADAVAQAVLFALFLAYPKSRLHFTDKFRKDLVIRISYWTTGLCPEFVDTAHWKLNLGGGDVLQAAASQPWQRQESTTALRPGPASAPQLSADSLASGRVNLIHRAPRPRRSLQYSPLVSHFLQSRKYSSVNLVRATSMNLTSAEERSKLMDVKHAMLVEQATSSREACDKLVQEYDEHCAEVRRQERQKQLQAQTARKRLEIRRKEVLRSDPHEYANYLVSLHLLQQGIGQGP